MRKVNNLIEIYPPSHYPITESFPLTMEYKARQSVIMQYFEPKIIIKLDGKKIFSRNGNRKRGEIKQAMRKR